MPDHCVKDVKVKELRLGLLCRDVEPLREEPVVEPLRLELNGMSLCLDPAPVNPGRDELEPDKPEIEPLLT